jgi:hypothetical protein
MNPKVYVLILVVMGVFMLLSPFKWLLVVMAILFTVYTLIKYLYWRNEFDYQ